MDTTDRFDLLDVKATDIPTAVFELDGKPLCFQGTNNYYLTFKSREMTDRVFDAMVAMKLPVMRTWAFLDRGSLDGTVPSIDDDGTKEGVYFQYWDSAQKRPAYNDGPDGLERLDYVLHAARKRGLKITMVLTNNWKDFGGMDQYVIWFDLKAHHKFFTDERARKAFKAYVTHLVNRKNSIDGTLYREDPAIFAWELANEPRCKNYGKFDDVVEGCKSHEPATAWAAEMSAYIKSIDPNHMVAVGDEGFLIKGRKHWAYQGQDGVDHEAFIKLPAVDFGTFHLYPDNWSTGVRFGTDWIIDHLKIAQEVGKPTMLEEYGTIIKRNEKFEIVRGWERRKTAYINWNQLMLKGGGAASMFWMLAAEQDDGKLYPDYDGYNVYPNRPTTDLLAKYARLFAERARACELAGPSVAPPSPFVRVRPAPRRGGSGATEPPRAEVVLEKSASAG